MSDNLVQQTTNALDFVQELYIEISYLIKEIEGLLGEEGFKIVKPNAYKITTYTSTSLELQKVREWLLRNLTVCFGNEEFVEGKSKTTTHYRKDLKLLVLHINLVDMDDQPKLLFGVLSRCHFFDNLKTQNYFTSSIILLLMLFAISSIYFTPNICISSMILK